MTFNHDEKELKNTEDFLGGTTVSDADLAIIGQAQSMSAGQSAMLASLASGRVMQNSVFQVQNGHSIQNAQTATGVASLMKRRSKNPLKNRFRNFTEQGKAH